ncbi:hypothetical protein [Cohnella sp. GCM10027633]|uniref:hypothetical protein n=1 Tax=unclassified Cohnella TaxID=2636738 RepID=UPI0036412AD5
MAVVHWRRWGILIASGLIAVVLLARLSAIDETMKQRRAAAFVFEPANAGMLRDDNLVNEMASLSADMRLLRVRWDHGILAVDLAASAPSDFWMNAAAIVTFAFKDKNNVGQVLIRAFDGNNDERALLSSIETRRTDWTEKELSRLRPTDLELDDAARSRVRMTITPAGERWLRNFAIS